MPLRGDRQPSECGEPTVSLTSRPRSLRRRGITVIGISVTVVVFVIVAALAFPVLVRLRERGRRIECEANLRKMGAAMERYRASSSGSRYPVGGAYNAQNDSSGTSWWLEILPYAESENRTSKWRREARHAGDFSVADVNGNVTIADGFRDSIFYCPSSTLPLFNTPSRHMSEENRRALSGKTPEGIPVPMYAAVAGSAPDAQNYDANPVKTHPWGRNTKDGAYGILSSSGVFPPNTYIEFAAVRDAKNRTILVGEQSDYVRNKALDPPDLYDVRSSWPRGAFMGSEGNYNQIRMAASGVDGDGSRRLWNVTTVRYPLNFPDFKAQGIVTDPPAPRPAKEGDPPPPLPPYPAAGYGPGHNHPFVSAHPGGVQLLMADGSAQFLNDDLDLELLLKMSTRDDGLEVSY